MTCSSSIRTPYLLPAKSPTFIYLLSLPITGFMRNHHLAAITTERTCGPTSLFLYVCNKICSIGI